MKLRQNEMTVQIRFAQKAVIASLAFTAAFLPSHAKAQTAPAAPAIPVPAAVVPEPNAPITPERTRALSLFRNITGVSISIDDPRLKSMEALLLKKQDAAAVKVATMDPLFYDVRVRDLARMMSTRDETVQAPLSDFVATFVGVVRDSDTTSGKLLLTGNFTYRADPTLTMIAGAQAVRQDEAADFISSNNHYADVQSKGFSLYAVLKRFETQKIMMNGSIVANPDPAGLITSRGFISAHADAGTNRRLVEYSFREFMCQPMTSWADATAPDDRVGRDVSRNPAGSNNKYLTTCKACHGQMDGLRGAFAHVDYVNNQILYTPTAVPTKMNRNSQEFPAGFVTTNDSFVNYATVGKNADAFGWRSTPTGNGMAQFGAMLANSQGFSRCMARRVFTSICKREPAASEEQTVRDLGAQFESSGYHMRGLFETVALRPECGINQ